MKIEAWSDYVCPFCYIGKRKLEKAIADSGYAGEIEVEYKSFLLDPTTPEDTDETTYEYLSKKYNQPIESIKQMTANVAMQAKEVGLDYNFDDMKSANTVKAHRLTKWINEQDADLGKQFTERVLKAYFLEGQAIGKDDVLLKLVEEFGLNLEEAKNVLASDRYNDEVNRDIYEAKQIGVRGVPFFVFHNKYGISGAQPQSLFEQTIEQAAQAAGLRKSIQIVADGKVCTDDSCEL